jgi:hypothetical protein
MRERAGWLVFLPEPCDFDQNAPSPAVVGLGYSLAPRRRSAVIGARCKTGIRSQLPSAGEGSGEHLASKDCRAGGAHSVQRDEQLSLLFDHRVLRVGRVAFLLNLTKLGLDQGKTCILAFEFATQPIWQRMVSSAAKSIRVRCSFGLMSRIPCANSNPLMRLMWPVRSRTRRRRSRCDRRASSSSTEGTRTIAQTWRSPRSVAIRARRSASASMRSS